jgi:hypothetical protein
MLLLTIGPRLSSPDIVPQLVPFGDVVAVLLPGHGLSLRRIKLLQDHAYVIEYLNAPSDVTSIIADATMRLGAIRKARGGPLVLINKPITVAEISSTLDKISERGMTVSHDPAGEPLIVAFSPEIAQNPMLPRFFSLLNELGIQDRRGLELLKQTFGDRHAD